MALGRKNWLFAGSEAGQRAAAARSSSAPLCRRPLASIVWKEWPKPEVGYPGFGTWPINGSWMNRDVPTSP